MLISPPLLAPNANFSPDFVAQGVDLLQGVYPVGPGQIWHGGCHLCVPASATHTVHAIADGIVVGYRCPTPKSSDANHPLNYRGWTDDGFVLLKHEKESGEGVPVVFYSLYMHLSQLENLFAGDAGKVVADGKKRVSRKDKLGQLGSIHGKADSMHFEIFTDTASCEKFFSVTEVEKKNGARVPWGEIYFFIPKGTAYTLDTPQPGKAVKAELKTTDDLRVSLRYENGDRILKAYRATGEEIGSCRDKGAEYELYKRAQQWFPKATSAGYELLRYGQQIGPDPLPTPASNWQPVPFGFGPRGWIDLNQPSIRRCSDADFPDWLWRSVKENEILFNVADSKCDVPELINIFDPTKSGVEAPLELKYALTHRAFQERTRSLVCLFPSEWDFPDAGAVEKKLGWVKDYFKNPASREKELAEKQKAWIKALCASTESRLKTLEQNVSDTQAGKQRHEAHRDQIKPLLEKAETDAKAAKQEKAKKQAALKALQKHKKTSSADLEKAQSAADEASQHNEQAQEAWAAYKREKATDDEAIAAADKSIDALTQAIASAKSTQEQRAKALAETDKAIAAADQALQQPAKDTKDSWERFTSHILALKWWDALKDTCGLGNSTVWHFHPMAFIEHYRKCGWLSKDEFISLNPSRIKVDGKFTKAITYAEMNTRITDAGEKRPASIYPQICKMMLKYGITTPLRQAHFMGQVNQETGQLEFMVEKGDDSYFDKYELGTAKGKELGNTKKDDGKRFKGRGLIQLTGRSNYTAYQNFRNADYTTDPNPTLLATKTYETCDAAGYFWTSRQRMATSTTKNGEQGINYWADLGFDEKSKKEVTKGVNPPMNHYAFRSQYFEHAYYVLNNAINRPDEYQPIDPETHDKLKQKK